MLVSRLIYDEKTEAEDLERLKYNVEGINEENETLIKPIEAEEVIVNGFIRKYILS